MTRDTFLEDAGAAMGAEVVGAVPEAGMLGRLIDKAGYVFAVGIVLAALILLVEVFLRYVLNSPTIWAHETTVFLCGVAFIFGGLYCTARNTHIRVVLLYDHFSPRARRIADIVISLVSALASGFFAFAAYHMVERAVVTPSGEVRLETTGSAWSPPTPALIKIFILLVMILLVVQFLILAVNYAKRASKD
ncbi:MULTISPECIES: TRAP transporter small permease [unclassified Ensifer]|uniref:TRAP transporter small permease subunit n=1 Tax=unclassified Ensifer TaxID=2633371 RepID=UPI0008F34A52|nr:MULTISPECIES: TRAP transporter small permease [unclassified Ensifer]OWZ89546.1 C4-dicarboxylate ABC transporter permease [Sinorhizobium sp. LM21]SFH44575.1 TRAP-type C4-dicarboxylate transport system, small permease component [Ensifer sp. OV372]